MSMITCVVFATSTLPALSRERYLIVFVPSPLDARIVTVVPGVHVVPPSRLYSVTAMPLRSEPGVSTTDTSWFCGPAGALSVVTGAVLSTVTSCGVTEQRPLPAASAAATQKS